MRRCCGTGVAHLGPKKERTSCGPLPYKWSSGSSRPKPIDIGAARARTGTGVGPGESVASNVVAGLLPGLLPGLCVCNSFQQQKKDASIAQAPSLDWLKGDHLQETMAFTPKTMSFLQIILYTSYTNIWDPSWPCPTFTTR